MQPYLLYSIVFPKDYISPCLVLDVEIADGLLLRRVVLALPLVPVLALPLLLLLTRVYAAHKLVKCRVLFK